MQIRGTMEVTAEIFSPADLAHSIYQMYPNEQLDLLVRLAMEPRNYREMVFCATEIKDRLDELASEEAKDKVKTFISTLYKYVCEDRRYYEACKNTHQ